MLSGMDWLYVMYTVLNYANSEEKEEEYKVIPCPCFQVV